MEQQEFPFTLPKGYVDEEGTVHREGSMRPALAIDEILPKKDPRVMSNPAYEVVIRLSRVITKLGTVGEVSPRVVENMYRADFDYLCAFYDKINERTTCVTCPICGHGFTVGQAAAKA